MSHSKIMVPTNDRNDLRHDAEQQDLEAVAADGADRLDGFGSTSSIASAIVFEMKPTERTAIASMPASAPSPTAETKIRPQTISCTERDIVIRKRPTTYELLPSGVMLRGAEPRDRDRQHAGRASVASVAISAVSSAGSTRSGSSARSNSRKRAERRRQRAGGDARSSRCRRSTIASTLHSTSTRIAAVGERSARVRVAPAAGGDRGDAQVDASPRSQHLHRVDVVQRALVELGGRALELLDAVLQADHVRAEVAWRARRRGCCTAPECGTRAPSRGSGPSPRARSSGRGSTSARRPAAARVLDQRARDADALALAAGKPVGALVDVLAQADAVEQRQRLLDVVAS